jgi:hypothetical protein
LGTILLSGANAGDFVVTSQPAATVAPGASTTFTITFQPTAAGSRGATVGFTANDPNQVSPFTFEIGGTGTAVNLAATTTTLTVPKGKFVAGQLVTLTAHVVSNGSVPNGSVTFMDGATTLGTGTVSNGIATLTIGLNGGSNSLRAIYSGNGTFATSQSSIVNETTKQNSTTTKVSSNATQPIAGDQVTLTVAVAIKPQGAGFPTGTVTLKEGTTVLGTGTLVVVNGTAQINFTITLKAGRNAFKAAFDGSTSSKGSVGKLSIKVPKK